MYIRTWRMYIIYMQRMMCATVRTLVSTTTHNKKIRVGIHRAVVIHIYIYRTLRARVVKSALRHRQLASVVPLAVYDVYMSERYCFNNMLWER